MLNNVNKEGLSEGLGVQGFIQLELVNEETGHKQIIQPNTVTDIGKALFLATGPAIQLMFPTQIDRGMLYVESSLTSLLQGAKNTRIPNIDQGITVNLINTTDVLNAQSRFLPVMTNGEVDSNKLIGYASSRRSPVTSKEGIIDTTKGEYLVDNKVVVQRWKFAESQANGVITDICIATGVHQNPASGFALSKGIHPADIPTFGGINRLEPSYIRPGVAGLTAGNELLVSLKESSYNPVSDAVYNIETGELVYLTEQDPRYGIVLGNYWSPQVEYNGDVYLITRNSELWRINGQSKAKTFVGNSFGTLFTEGNTLYFNYHDAIIRGYNLDTLQLDPSKDINLESQVFTSKFFRDARPNYALMEACLGRDLDGNYIILPTVDASGPNFPIVCSDIRNIEASVIGFRPYTKSVSEYAVGGKRINIWANVNPDMGEYTYIDNFSTQGYNRAKDGLKISENQFGNLISYVHLSSPITKTAQDSLYISYGYRYV